MFHSQLGWTHHLACQLAASFISPQGCDRQIILGSLHEIRRLWEQDAPFRSLQLVCLPQLIQRRFAEELSLRFKIILLLEEINFKKLRSYYSFPELLILHSVLFPWLINTGWPLGHGLFFFRFYLFIFRERGREGQWGEEKHQCVVASHVPPKLGTWPATQACALSGNRTGDSLVLRLALSPLRHTSQGDPDYS